MQRPPRSSRAAAAREKKGRAADALQHETIELAKHLTERRAAAHFREDFGVEAVGHQRRADAVARDVAHEQREVFVVLRAHQAEIAADRAHGIEERFDAHAAPDDGLRREALLHARGQREIFLDFLVALLELRVGLAELLLRALLFRNVGEHHDAEHVAFEILDAPRADDHRQTLPVFLR